MGFEKLAELKAQLARESQLAKRQSAQPQAAPKPPRRERSAQSSANRHVTQKTAPVDPVVRVIGKLQKQFAVAFPKSPAPKVPLKVGILSDLLAHADELKLSEAEIRDALSTWCRGNRYWTCLTDGAPRVDLTGAPAGLVNPRDAAFARRQATRGSGTGRRDRNGPDSGNPVAASPESTGDLP